ncbi:Amidase [Terriglobus saanensis SP1PR4]|uniref:Amidase n=2 Tax=Terriglobus saanensis TaxID=870903 RepID=E8V342_TERSS|nr:Amidase [Terriglobus saanensis SP1PR4]
MENVLKVGSEPLRPIAQTLQCLARGEVTSRSLTDDCLRAVADPQGEGKRTFTRVYEESARTTADEVDLRRSEGVVAGPLAGLPISIKDLFDVAGETTLSGSTVLADAPSATADAAVVSRLRQAGAVLIGRTNMTEFAYSGLGLNPHYGTPKNPYDRATGRIPGGSSSGAAVSVSDGMAAAAVGSDTGGSIRIPAALCGLTGFKPTARRVSMEGVLPLSPTLDSIGVIAPTVACCALVDAVLAGQATITLLPGPLSGMRFGVLRGFVLDGMEDEVARAFYTALSTLSKAGAKVEDLYFGSLDRVPGANQFAAPEAFAWHRELLAMHGDRYDPHVAIRIRHGAGVYACDYLDLFTIRTEIMREAARTFEGFDAVLLPTVPCIAPAIATLEASDDAYFDANGAVLRNPSLFNYLDGCALSIPCHRPGEAPVGLMVAGLGGWDARILRVGAAIEAALLQQGCAIFS